MNAILCYAALPGRRAGAAIAGGARPGLRLLVCLAVLAALFLHGAPRAYAADEPSAPSDGPSAPVDEPSERSAGWCHFSYLTPPDKPSFTSTTPAGTSIRFRWNGVATSGGPVTDYTIYVATADGQDVSETLVTAHESMFAPHDATVDGLIANTAYEVRLRARTILGCYSAFSDVETVTTTAGDGS